VETLLALEIGIDVQFFALQLNSDEVDLYHYSEMSVISLDLNIAYLESWLTAAGMWLISVITCKRWLFL